MIGENAEVTKWLQPMRLKRRNAMFVSQTEMRLQQAKERVTKLEEALKKAREGIWVS